MVIFLVILFKNSDNLDNSLQKIWNFISQYSFIKSKLFEPICAGIGFGIPIQVLHYYFFILYFIFYLIINIILGLENYNIKVLEFYKKIQN